MWYLDNLIGFLIFLKLILYNFDSDSVWRMQSMIIKG